MSSVAGSDDRTAAARIRDAAIALFGELGTDKATIRGVAAAAGVSPALVLHHFGSKEGLRAACDEYVVAEYRRSKQDAVESGTTDPFAALAGVEKSLSHLRYLSRAIRDGSPAASRLFDEMVAESKRVMQLSVAKGLLRPSEAPHDRAVLMVAWQFGGLVLHEHVARGMGAEPFSTELTARIARAALEVLTHGVFTDARYADAWQATDRSGDDHTAMEPNEEDRP